MYWNTFITKIVAYILLFFLVFIITRKILKRKVPRVIIAATILTFLLSIALAVYPVERWLLTFDTPEALAEYVYPDATVLIVEGENTALLHNIEVEQRTPMLRIENGYRYCGPGTSMVAVGNSETFGMGYRDTFGFSVFSIGDDYYVYLKASWLPETSPLDGAVWKNVIPIDAEVQVSDSLGTNFQFFDVTFDEETRSFSALAFLDGFDKNYTITIEDQASGNSIIGGVTAEKVKGQGWK